MNASRCAISPDAMFRPHDLLWVRAPLSLAGPALPEWVDADWPVVVRRAEPLDPEAIPVGLRGRERHQRHAAWLDRAQVSDALSPEALASALWARVPDPVPAALEALRTLAPYLDEIGLPWGPSGSAGFALATGIAVLRPDSDLDLLIRAAAAPTARQTNGLKALQGLVPCRLDIQIDTGVGGFALNEWLSGRRRVLLKTARGPFLVADPWQSVESEARPS